MTEHSEEVKTLLRKCQIAKNSAYTERNQLVSYLSKQYHSHLCRHPDEDKEWEAKWRWIVCIHGPTGQMTWHIHDKELKNFRHLRVHKDHWDGHTNDEKYKRLKSIKPSYFISKKKT